MTTDIERERLATRSQISMFGKGEKTVFFILGLAVMMFGCILFVGFCELTGLKEGQSVFRAFAHHHVSPSVMFCFAALIFCLGLLMSWTSSRDF